MNIKKHSLFTRRGFTLLELVIVVAMVAILLTIGMPSLTELIKNNRVSSQNNELVAMLSFAKSVAIRNNITVPVELTSSADGWTGRVEDPLSDEEVTGCGPGVLRCSSNRDVAMASGTVSLTFNNRGYLRDADDAWTAETIYLQHANCQGARQRRRIDIMPTGQISSCNLSCGSTAACPP